MNSPKAKYLMPMLPPTSTRLVMPSSNDCFNQNIDG